MAKRSRAATRIPNWPFDAPPDVYPAGFNIKRGYEDVDPQPTPFLGPDGTSSLDWDKMRVRAFDDEPLVAGVSRSIWIDGLVRGCMFRGADCLNPIQYPSRHLHEENVKCGYRRNTATERAKAWLTNLGESHNISDILKVRPDYAKVLRYIYQYINCGLTPPKSESDQLYIYKNIHTFISSSVMPNYWDDQDTLDIDTIPFRLLTLALGVGRCDTVNTQLAHDLFRYGGAIPKIGGSKEGAKKSDDPADLKTHNFKPTWLGRCTTFNDHNVLEVCVVPDNETWSWSFTDETRWHYFDASFFTSGQIVTTGKTNTLQDVPSLETLSTRKFNGDTQYYLLDGLVDSARPSSHRPLLNGQDDEPNSRYHLNDRPNWAGWNKDNQLRWYHSIYPPDGEHGPQGAADYPSRHYDQEAPGNLLQPPAPRICDVKCNESGLTISWTAFSASNWTDFVGQTDLNEFRVYFSEESRGWNYERHLDQLPLELKKLRSGDSLPTPLTLKRLYSLPPVREDAPIVIPFDEISGLSQRVYSCEIRWGSSQRLFISVMSAGRRGICAGRVLFPITEELLIIRPA
ncbi:MAG TPA: hypothetical protein VFI23_10270 [Rhizomicrobium sp.]|nr:hypothetical protein [Rhizomicrobium sp.]